MGSLIARLLALFAFKSRKGLLVAMGVVGLVLAAPALFGPTLRDLGLGRRARLVTDIAAIDRAKLKEPLLRESFDALLEDFAAVAGSAEAKAAAPAAKPTAAKPAAPKPTAKGESEAAAPEDSGPSWTERLFGNGTVWTFLAGSSLWILLGLSGLFASGVKIGGRIGTLALFLALGTACGIVAGRIDTFLPFTAFAALFVFAELAALSFLGTMTGELGARK